MADGARDAEEPRKNIVDLVGMTRVVPVGQSMARVEVRVPLPKEMLNDRVQGDGTERFSMLFHGDAAKAALEHRDAGETVMQAQGYVSVYFDKRANTNVVSLTGTSLGNAPPGLTARNYVRFSGNLGGDPEFSHKEGKKERASMSVAIGKGKFVRVAAFDSLAVKAHEEIKKGFGVAFEGRLKNNVFERKDGSKGFELQVIANNLEVEHVKAPEITYLGRIATTPELSEKGKQPRFAFLMEYANAAGENVRTQVVEFGPAATALAALGLKRGDAIQVTGKETSREYNGKTYREVRASSLERASLEQETGIVNAPAPAGRVAPEIDASIPTEERDFRDRAGHSEVAGSPSSGLQAEATHAVDRAETTQAALAQHGPGAGASEKLAWYTLDEARTIVETALQDALQKVGSAETRTPEVLASLSALYEVQQDLGKLDYAEVTDLDFSHVDPAARAACKTDLDRVGATVKVAIENLRENARGKAAEIARESPDSELSLAS